MDDRRLGYFVIPEKIVREHCEFAKEILKGMLVLNAKWRFDLGGVEYVATSERFISISECEDAPTYNLEIEWKTWTSPVDGHQEKKPLEFEFNKKEIKKETEKEETEN